MVRQNEGPVSDAKNIIRPDPGSRLPNPDRARATELRPDLTATCRNDSVTNTQGIHPVFRPKRQKGKLQKLQTLSSAL